MGLVESLNSPAAMLLIGATLYGRSSLVPLATDMARPLPRIDCDEALNTNYQGCGMSNDRPPVALSTATQYLAVFGHQGTISGDLLVTVPGRVGLGLLEDLACKSTGSPKHPSESASCRELAGLNCILKVVSLDQRRDLQYPWKTASTALWSCAHFASAVQGARQSCFR